MGLVEFSGYGNTTLTRLRIEPGPPLTPGGRPRLLSTSWDGIQHQAVQHGPTVTGCTITSAGDDTWSIQTQDYVVVRMGPGPDGTPNASLALAFRNPGSSGLHVGDRLLAWNGAPVTAVIAASTRTGSLAECGADPNLASLVAAAPAYSYWQVGPTCYNITLTAPGDAAGIALGGSLVCPDRMGNGFVFSHNTVLSSGRGALVKAADGLIFNNTITASEHAVIVDPEVPANATVAIANLVITGNTIVGAGCHHNMPWSGQAGGVGVGMEGVGGAFVAPTTPPAAGGAQLLTAPIMNVTLTGNTVVGTCGVNLVLASVAGATVAGNTFSAAFAVAPGDTGASFAVPQQALLYVAAAADVSFADNVVADGGDAPLELGPYGRNCSIVGPGATNVTGLAGGAAGGLACAVANQLAEQGHKVATDQATKS
jgi:hypothetical protein